MRTRKAVCLVAGVVAVAGLFRCGSVPLTAPAGSAIFAQANPPFVIANGGTSVVTAMVTMPNGMLVPNGTEVYFFTDLGRIDASVQTRDGVAHANFISDSRSGTANVTIWSGGSAPAANPSTTPSPTPTPAGFAPPTGGLAARAASGRVTAPVGGARPLAASTNSGTGSTTLTIDIGSALPAKVVVSANPDRITTPRHSTIVANVFDGHGNPVQNVPVVFSVAPQGGAALEETMASGGIPQFTDSNGQAFDELDTRALNGTSQKVVQVTATLPAGSAAAGTVNVFIDYTPASAFGGR